jgi:hypothetical protein
MNNMSLVLRSLGFVLAGILIGLFVGYGFAPTIRKTETSGAEKTVAALNQSRIDRESSAQKSSAEENKIVLGNIITVPFQELYGLLASRSQEEVTQLAEQLRELPPGRETNMKIGVFFKAWAHLDPKAAFAAATGLKTADSRAAAIGAIIDGADPIAASSLAQSVVALSPDAFPIGQRAGFLGLAVSKWSEVDPVAAAKFLDASGTNDRALMGTRAGIARNWAASDPQAALAWAQKSSEEPGARFAVSAAITGWWHADPRAAEAYVASHLDTVGMDAVMSLTRQIFGQDPQRAKDWANQLPSAEARRSATSFLAMQMANSDPKSAAEWVLTLPDELRDRAIPGVVGTWAHRDPEAAAGWINGLSGPSRDQAVSAYGFSLSNKDPNTALAWAATIGDETARTRSVQRIVTDWLRRHPAEATAWIQKSTLADTEKARLLEQPPGR